MSDALTAALEGVVAQAVRAEVRAAVADLLPALVAAVCKAAPSQKRRLTLSEAKELLPGGCRAQRMLKALASGALRGEQRDDGRRTWTVDVDDLLRWDAAGRPEAKP